MACKIVCWAVGMNMSLGVQQEYSKQYKDYIDSTDSTDSTGTNTQECSPLGGGIGGGSGSSVSGMLVGSDVWSIRRCALRLITKIVKYYSHSNSSNSRDEGGLGLPLELIPSLLYRLLFGQSQVLLACIENTVVGDKKHSLLIVAALECTLAIVNCHADRTGRTDKTDSQLSDANTGTINNTNTYSDTESDVSSAVFLEIVKKIIQACVTRYGGNRQSTTTTTNANNTNTTTSSSELMNASNAPIPMILEAISKLQVGLRSLK